MSLQLNFFKKVTLTANALLPDAAVMHMLTAWCSCGSVVSSNGGANFYFGLTERKLCQGDHAVLLLWPAHGDAASQCLLSQSPAPAAGSCKVIAIGSWFKDIHVGDGAMCLCRYMGDACADSKGDGVGDWVCLT